MRDDILLSHRIQNSLHTLILLGGTGALLVGIGWFVWGGLGAMVAIVLTLGFLIVGPPVSNRWILRLYRARPLAPSQAPELFEILAELARRAQLPRLPQLYYIPSAVINAFALGKLDRSAIGLTDGLLRRLNSRELAGVLGHEVGHIRNGDLSVMALADFVSRLTNQFSFVGLVFLFLDVPLLLLGRISPMSLVPIALLIVAPNLSILLQLALSRTREFAADLEAVRLTGDPRGLASALAKMEYYQQSWTQRILLPGRRNPDPSYLRSHPETRERIERLQSFVEPPAPRYHPLSLGEGLPRFLGAQPRIVHLPRWRVSGLWF